MGSSRPDEFETIARLLRPLADHTAARGLLDDVAVLEPPPGRTLVLTHDTMVAGVHFWPDDPPDLIARKLLRVNLSDLVAKGADPFGYLMSCAWADGCDWHWREAFVRGLQADQAAFGLTLLGGDTVSTPGPLTLGATLIGWGEPGGTPSRAGAEAGDAVLVSGMVGDAGLGLRVTQGEVEGLGEGDLLWLADRYRIPRPSTELTGLVRRAAHASADVSDGLLADVGNIAAASGVSAVIDLEAIPLSDAAQRWCDNQPDPARARLDLATAGDDYEILLIVSPNRADEVVAEAVRLGRSMTLIGRCDVGQGVTARYRGTTVKVTKAGWRHR